MMQRLVAIIMLLFSFASSSCSKDTDERVEAKGILKVQGITSYQYGTHVIAGYALRSSTIDLDNYIDQNVTVVGAKVDGYPVEDGPDYIHVEKVIE